MGAVLNAPIDRIFGKCLFAFPPVALRLFSSFEEEQRESKTETKMRVTGIFNLF